MRTAAIAGIGNTAFTDGSAGETGIELALAAIAAAAEDAGLGIHEIDGIVKYNIDPSASHEMLIANLGMEHLGFAAETPAGGSGSCMTAQLAEAAVISGQARAVLCYRSFTRADFGSAIRHNAAWLHARASGMGDFVRPYGWGTLGQVYALQACRHMAEHGTTEAQLGAIVAATTKHASRNPNALRPDAISVDEYLDLPYVTSPLREPDLFVKPSVGACAFIVTSAERAADLRQRPVHIAGAVSSIAPAPPPNWEMLVLGERTLTGSGADHVAPRLYERAGLRPEDVDVAEIYDCSSYGTLSALEAYGFCGPGEGGPFVEGGRIELDGELPVNTHGGHLAEAYIHGFNHILEGVRQIRGISTAQVDGAEVALVTGGPGPMSSGMLLTAEPAR
jgi:acetyl-CoA acetyltransferase